jgi:predicted nucleotidyltransferase
MALCGGADLVLELPFPWSCAGAESFAEAGIHILLDLGVDTLALGSETGDLPLLRAAAQATEMPGFQDACAGLLRNGAGTAEAFIQTLRAFLEHAPSGCPVPAHFPCSNDLLAINYLRALNRQGGPMTPLVLRRQGQSYREEVLRDPTAPSASALRRLILENIPARPARFDNQGNPAGGPLGGPLGGLLEGTMPSPALELLLSAIRAGTAPTNENALLPYFHGLFRLSDPSTLGQAAELSGGLADRMVRAARETGRPEEFMEALGTRLYPDARLRRGMLYAAAGVRGEDVKSPPAYTTLLAANATGCRFLRSFRKRIQKEGRRFQVVTKPAHAPAGRQNNLSAQADSLFTLCLPVPTGADWLIKQSPYILSDHERSPS